jgi:hypothetical protein
MSKGFALHIGINQVDEDKYGIKIPPLFACENDALSLEQITTNSGFQSHLLLSSSADTTTIIKTIKDSAKQLKSGDTFFISYSGHGSQIPDLKGDEIDRADECWICYDKPLLDDELYQLWGLFKEGVKIIFISDSCHSGTMVKSGKKPVTPRLCPTSLLSTMYADKKKLGQLKNKLTKLSAQQTEIKAGIIALSACKDKEVALEGQNYGLFTECLIKTINSNLTPKRGQKPKRLTPNYLITEAKKLLKGKQTPTYSKLGNIPRQFLLESIL